MSILPHDIYVSGIHQSINQQEICDRFSSFGNVKDGEKGVKGRGLDANGIPKTFAFLTLETTAAGMAKCTSMLSGSMWKGHKLRIAPAKLSYHARMEAERKEAAAELERGITKKVVKKRKRNPDPLVGEMSKRIELITSENFKRHKGWNTEASSTTPLFPLICRPTHPLPAPPKAAPTAWTREAPKSKASKAARAIAKAGSNGVLGIVPITRSRKVMIDVRKWGRTKTVFKDSAKINKSWWGAGRVGEWECEEPELLQDEKLDQVKWIFKANDGSVKQTEFIKLTARSTPHTDSFAALLNLLEPTPTAITELVSLPAIILPTPTKSVSIERPRSASPPPYLSIPTKSLMYNEDDTFALLVATQDTEQMKDAIQQEMNVGMNLLKSFIKEDVFVKTVRKEVSRPEVEGFGDESDDAEEVLQLRGGAGSDEEEDSSSDEEEIDVAMEEAEQPKTILQMGDLKDMFKPQEAAQPFSIFSSLALDLPASRSVSPETISYAPYNPNAVPAFEYEPPQQSSSSFIPPAALGGRNRAWIGTASVGSFFMLSESDIVPEGVSEQRRLAAIRESVDRVKSGTGFWRNDSIEQIEAAHQTLRENLRGGARKRHREAAKRLRKKDSNKRGTGGGGGGFIADEE